MALRKKLVINKKEQSSFIFTIGILCFFVIFVNVVNIYVLANHFILKEASAENIKIIQDIFTQVVSSMKLRIAILFIINIFVIAGAGLFISHKFSGPSFNISRELRQIMEGDLTARIKLRTGDQLCDIADSVNLMAGELQESICITKEMAENLVIKIESDPDAKIKYENECKDLMESLKKFTLKKETLES